jgi:hypothetical protein
MLNIILRLNKSRSLSSKFIRVIIYIYIYQLHTIIVLPDQIQQLTAKQLIKILNLNFGTWFLNSEIFSR